MTKEYLETILTEYGVAFTDSLADRLLKEFEPSNDMVSRGVFEQVMWERDVAIEQLKELGYELGQKVEPCENTISRQSAIFLASDLKQDLPDDERIADMVMAHNEGVLEYQTQLSLLPPVNPTKTGHWTRELIRNEKGGCIGAKMICSECGKDNKHDEYMTYCPNCGAKMQESEEV